MADIIRVADGAFPYHNRILNSLPNIEKDLLQSHFRRFDIVAGQCIYAQDQPIEHLCFIDGGIACSLDATVDSHGGICTAVMGLEGVCGTTTLLVPTARTYNRGIMVTAGAIVRLRIDTFLSLQERLPMLDRLLREATLLRWCEGAQSLACGLSHTLQQRLARWLLMASERSGIDHITVGQSMLARMLGSRRSTVNLSLLQFRTANAIQVRRNAVVVADRARLAAFVCPCYERHQGFVCDTAERGAPPPELMTA